MNGYTAARAEHRAECEAIYAAAFPADTPQDCAELFDAYFPAAVRLWLENGCVVSQLFLLPAPAQIDENKLKLVYLYAAATELNARGRGMFTALLRGAAEELRRQGTDGIFLHPQTPELTGFYTARGFIPRREDGLITAVPAAVRDAVPAWITAQNVPLRGLLYPLSAFCRQTSE